MFYFERTKAEYQMENLEIAIAGGGVGGMTAAIALQARGHDVSIFEQAKAYGRIGADVNLTPNAVHALDGLGAGIGSRMRETAARPAFRISRMWDDGRETSRLPMSDAAEEKYGAPQLTIHRADLLSALEAALAPAPSGSAPLSPGSNRARRAQRCASRMAAASGPMS
jgi:salicylate hydroxylase